MYQHREFNGQSYVHYGMINACAVYMSEHIPQSTRQKLTEFLQQQGREWMLEHIGQRSDQHFRRADPAIDNHFYRMTHPSGTQLEVLVDRN